MSWCGLFCENMDSCLVYDDYGCYLTKFIFSRQHTLFYIYNCRVGAADVQQTRLERMAGQALTSTGGTISTWPKKSLGAAPEGLVA